MKQMNFEAEYDTRSSITVAKSELLRNFTNQSPVRLSSLISLSFTDMLLYNPIHPQVQVPVVTPSICLLYYVLVGL